MQKVQLLKIQRLVVLDTDPFIYWAAFMIAHGGYIVFN